MVATGITAGDSLLPTRCTLLNDQECGVASSGTHPHRGRDLVVERSGRRVVAIGNAPTALFTFWKW